LKYLSSIKSVLNAYRVQSVRSLETALVVSASYDHDFREVTVLFVLEAGNLFAGADGTSDHGILCLRVKRKLRRKVVRRSFSVKRKAHGNHLIIPPPMTQPLSS